jgi:hypothetical protein
MGLCARRHPRSSPAVARGRGHCHPHAPRSISGVSNPRRYAADLPGRGAHAHVEPPWRNPDGRRGNGCPSWIAKPAQEHQTHHGRVIRPCLYS